MICPDDLAIATSEPDLPGLRTLLDDDAVAQQLSDALPEHGVRGVRRTYVRYKRAASAIALYEVTTGSGRQWWYLRTTPKSAPKKAARAWIELRDCDAFPFPADRRLRALPLVMDPDRFAAAFAPRLAGSAHRVVETINYKPERRWVGRFVAEDRPVWVLKLFANREQRLARTRATSFRPEGELQLASIVGQSSARDGLVAFEWIDGTPLPELANDPSGPPAYEVAGQALARLHGQRPPRLLHHSPAQIAARIAELADGAERLAPKLRRRIDEQRARLVAGLQTLEPRYASVHGDFYAKQVIATQSGACMIDLDEAHTSCPEVDLGLFCAHLRYDSLRRRIAPDVAQRLGGSLLAGYGLGSVEPRTVDLFTAAGLFTLLHHPFRHAAANWHDLVEALLAEVASVPDFGPQRTGARTPRSLGRRVDVIDPYGLSADPKLACLSDALVPDTAERGLREQGVLNEDERLDEVRVTRHKPGRRCVIEFELRDALGERRQIVGKARARGADGTTFETMIALRDAGLSELEGSPAVVPEPIALIPQWRMWCQQRVAGTGGFDAFTGPYGLEAATRIGDALSRLHCTGVTATRKHTLQDEVEILHARLGEASRARPDLAQRIAGATRACDALAAGIDALEGPGIHRDFYPDQVIVSDRDVFILDLDLYTRGDPAIDVGNFCAHLIEFAIRERGGPAGFLGIERAFRASVRSVTGRSAAVDAYTTLSLARHIRLSQRFERRRPFTERVLAECERRLGLQPSTS